MKKEKETKKTAPTPKARPLKDNEVTKVSGGLVDKHLKTF